MEPSISAEKLLGEELNAQLQAIARILFEEFEDVCLPPFSVHDMGCNNATNNAKMEANFAGETESSSGSTLLTCPLCGSLTPNISYLDEMLDGGSTGGIVASQVQPFLDQEISFEETSHDLNGMPIEETHNNVIGSSSNGVGIVGFPMEHGGYVGVSTEVKATEIAGNAKIWTRRTRYKKGSPEAARQKEIYKIRNREAAARSFAQKQAHIRNLELQVLTLQKENAFRRKLLMFLESNPVGPATQRRLWRTASGSVQFSTCIDLSHSH